MGLRWPNPPPPPPVRDASDGPEFRRAVEFVMAVKAAIPPDQYKQLLHVMNDVTARWIDINAVVLRISALLQGHADLLNTFYTFVPPEYTPAPSAPPLPPPPPPPERRGPPRDASDQQQDRFSVLLFVVAVKDAVSPHQFLQLEQVLHDFLAGRIDTNAYVLCISGLLQGHADLLNTFYTFVAPEYRPAPSAQSDSSLHCEWIGGGATCAVKSRFAEIS